MNIEKVIELARDAKLPHYYQTNEINLDALESFAKLVGRYAVKVEREACAKVCDEIVARYRHADDAPEMVAADTFEPDWVNYRQGLKDGAKAEREWVGLTDEEIWSVYTQVDSMQYMEFSHAIEDKLKEKNT